MMEFVAGIPMSIMLLFNGVVLALIGVYFSRKQSAANVADKITAAAERSIDDSEKRIKRLEQDATISRQTAELSRQKERKLSARVSSLENNDRENQAWIQSLEKKHDALLKQMREWNKGIGILITQIEGHDSKPNWRPQENQK